MKYLCLAYYDTEVYEEWMRGDTTPILAQCEAFDCDLRTSGQLDLVASLAHGDVMTIRPGNGGPAVTDGPFAETKEQVGSFFLVEARDLNDAVRVASKHPAAWIGAELGWAVEVRPIERYERI